MYEIVDLSTDATYDATFDTEAAAIAYLLDAGVDDNPFGVYCDSEEAWTAIVFAGEVWRPS